MRKPFNLFNRIKTLTPLEGYNRWAETYHTEDNPIKNLSDEFIRGELPDLKGKSVLDAGCGTGKVCMMAIERGASPVKGIDLSPNMIQEAKKNCPQAEFVCADLSSVILDKYDVIVCGLVLGHIDQLPLTKLVNALKPGGDIILTDFHPHQTMMKAKRTFRYNGKTFEVKHSLHELEEYFSILRTANINIAQFKEPVFKGNPVIFGIHGVAA